MVDVSPSLVHAPLRAMSTLAQLLRDGDGALHDGRELHMLHDGPAAVVWHLRTPAEEERAFTRDN